MNEYYTREQAMELLGITSINAFLQLARKYPSAFVNISTTNYKLKHPRYDKAALDNFYQMRKDFKGEKP
jgi:hypothetical protein